jgi:RNA polymerase sigma-70 factor (ECF subfamily)
MCDTEGCESSYPVDSGRGNAPNVQLHVVRIRKTVPLPNQENENTFFEERDISQVVEQVRAGNSEMLGSLLNVYRNYMLFVTANHLGRRLRQRLDPSDLVQEAMLAAHRDFEDFRGCTERELMGWLRKILIHCIGHAVETHVKARKRDIRREAPQQLLPDASNDAEPWIQNLKGKDSTPSEIFGRGEASLKLLQQLSKLKPEYRDVIVFRNLEGLSFDEVAARMGRKPTNVRMLWLRAIEKFRETCLPIDGSTP